MYYSNNNTNDYKSQVEKILKKAQIKKSYNKNVIAWLESEKNIKKADIIRDCATMIGFTDVGGVAHVTRGNFCRERICSVCAWRRQARFVAQMSPVLEKLKGDGYEFLFVTLTIKNVDYGELGECVDRLLLAYHRLLNNRRIKRSWRGKIRSLEVTYNSNTKEFHPHIHILVAVKPNYFNSEDYISLSELIGLWGSCLDVDYSPSVDISKVTDDEVGAVETLKYAFKPSTDYEALKGFFYVLKNRRLVSFSGVFAEVRKFLKFSSFEDVLTDDMNCAKGTKFACILYKFDSTGGVYKFFDKMTLEV